MEERMLGTLNQSKVWKNLFGNLDNGDIIQYSFGRRRGKGKVEHWYISSDGRMFVIELIPLRFIGKDWKVRLRNRKTLTLSPNQVFRIVKVIG